MKYKIILWVSAFLFILSLFFFFESNKKLDKLDMSKVIDYSDINFAWEKVNFDSKNFFNKEKLDKELNITRFNIYQFVLYHKREPVYFPIIEKKLKEAWIPDDFKYLAVAESWLKNDALSDSNAGWIWQFIPETAKRHWLIINDSIDERYNFEKETDAAIRYFKKLHLDFWNWTLAAAAYNRGENWLRRALDDQKVNSYYDLYLNAETARYIWRILAIKYLMINKYEIFNQEDLWIQYTVPKTKEIFVSDKIDNLKSWSQERWISYSSLKQLNQWIIWDNLPKWNWSIKVLNY
ncbi:MAG: Lytic transglycosylase catalytic [uncultured bacterium (gcode 4)]|uniref:Lytic transglycosylase catalytic n=1 Tax=uncultured bacterium (gcode 4) TaxID=1234023 RepID=K2FXR1_9BACT|nr:MAG: Lytic transglycosylase catalytic [uncultured bacterium (gcode 4)]